MSLVDYLANVKDKETFIEFVNALIEERSNAENLEQTDPGSFKNKGAFGWENTSIESYLQAADQISLPVKSNMVPNYTTSVVDTIEPIVVRSGEKYTVAQLQAIPFAKLLQPDTEYTMESAYVAVDLPNGDLTEYKVTGTTMPKRLPELISRAKSGNMITIEKRIATTKEGIQVKLPSLVYFVK